MQRFICTTCGVQYTETEQPPLYCPVCQDERQYVNPLGQQWTNLNDMHESGEYKNDIVQEEKHLYSITTSPSFGIGQTAYLIQSQQANVLWDCVTYLDDETITRVQELGGIDYIAISHPHYYASMVEWAETFDAQIYIHQGDKDWNYIESAAIHFWADEDLSLTGDVTLIHLGGHFRGGTVLNRSTNEGEAGLLFSGDIIQIVADTSWVSFMYSYPNLIPLPADQVRTMARRVIRYDFDRIYGAFHKKVPKDAKHVIQKSATRYIQALEGKLFQT